MTANGNAGRLIAALRGAAWTEVRRTGTGHMLYACPCGQHFATVTASTTKDTNKNGPIQARIKRCTAAQIKIG